MDTIELDKYIAFTYGFTFPNSAVYFVNRCNRQILVVNFDAGGLMRNVPREVIY